MAVQLIDTGVRRDDDRPQFERLISRAERGDLVPDGAPIIVASELTRVFRNRRDRARVDALVEDGKADLLLAREDLDTSKPEGRRRYQQAADLVTLSYEGGWADVPGETRPELVDRYLDTVLVPWLGIHGVPDEELRDPVADVRARLLSLAARWDQSARVDPLLGGFVELAERHDPEEVDVRFRALALVGVRNSALEDLHLADHISQSDWRVLTQAAAWALAGFDDALPAAGEQDNDPFDGLPELYPVAAVALGELATLEPGGIAEWDPVDLPAPEPIVGDAAVPLTEEGYEVLHAMDPTVSFRSANALATFLGEGVPFLVPSLKHISRNPHKLLRLADCVLRSGGGVVTANVHLTPTSAERRAEAVSYNEPDFAWAGVDVELVLPSKVNVGRNDPCPCGSGKKYKRCCGA
jgi:hypothetical protein